ncbi:hypothetical protein ANCCEY_08816 [Ancylostoma ceylanicum]|uniref:glucuronosyltransferase n=1 Tax=Ancylostoma ceylanicum TaxID=53326 RepID=A0A0D6LJC1_9BILA|nr:hypothetical protein ANCCEY_08816 [Ancylostoma ceylanicum]
MICKRDMCEVSVSRFDTVVVDDLYNPCGLLQVALKGAHKHYPGVATAFDIERNASINFVNNPPIFDFARPYMPRVNFVGGLHCRNATALGGALNDFVKGASDDEGFVLITSGFTAKWEKAPQWVKSTFVKDVYLGTFRALPNVRFVWQYDGEPIKHLPPNVFTQSWLPQQDLLGYPKCRTHISHGGINSVIESVWHGVPTIGIPLTVADKLNVFQYFLVDVILFMISVLLLIFATIFYISLIVFRILRFIIKYPFSRTRGVSAKLTIKKKN